MVVSSQFAYYQHFAQGEGVEVDASRIATSVVSGIGFMDVVSELGATVRDVKYSRRLDTKKHTTLTFDVKLPLCVTMGELVDTIERHPGVKRVSVVFSR
ncbi:hypothetical protein LVJ94_31175 [Pendulispora rubella]|uniref:ACT domain-containing protein n=1 Tax=Pendulispora rubella TaxID=2741070 RepID=A0ABZ2KRT0_9BACT